MREREREKNGYKKIIKLFSKYLAIYQSMHFLDYATLVVYSCHHYPGHQLQMSTLVCSVDRTLEPIDFMARTGQTQKKKKKENMHVHEHKTSYISYSF